MQSKDNDLKEPEITVQEIKEAAKDPKKLHKAAQTLGIDEKGNLPAEFRFFENEKIELLAPYEILRVQLKNILELLEIASQAYRMMPTCGNAQAVAMIQSACKEIMRDMRELVDPKKTMDSIVNEIIAPLFKEVVRTLAVEINQSQRTISQHIPPEQHNIIDQVFADIVSAAGTQSNTILKNYQKKLADILGVKSD
jgi:hypothetical protein